MAHSPCEQRDDVRVSHTPSRNRRVRIPGCPGSRREPANTLEIGGVVYASRGVSFDRSGRLDCAILLLVCNHEYGYGLRMAYLDPRPSPRPTRRRKPPHSWEREALVIMCVVVAFLAMVAWVSTRR